MKSGERFHKFLERTKFRKSVRKGFRGEIRWPDFIQTEIQQKATNCFAFSWGGEVNSVECAQQGADSIVSEYPWLSAFRYELARAIEKY